MMSTTTTRLITLIDTLSEVPFFGNAPSFDFAALSQALSDHFGLSVKLQPGALKKKSSLPKNLSSLIPITIFPLEEPLFIKASATDITKLTTTLLQEKEKISKVLQQGFFRYLLLETMNLLSSKEPFSSFTFQLEEESPIENLSLQQDLTLSFEETKVTLSLLIPKAFEEAFSEHFENLPPQPLSIAVQDKTEVLLSVQLGSCPLTEKELKDCAAGDFIPLRNFSYNPEETTGTCQLIINGQPWTSATLDQDQITPKEETPLLELSPIQLELTRERLPLRAFYEKTSFSLPNSPTEEITLLANQEPVAKAELLQLHDIWGLRLLDFHG